MNEKLTSCAICPYKATERYCRSTDGRFPEFCPTKNKGDLIEKSLQTYTSNYELCEFAKQAAIQEAQGYTNNKLGYRHVRAVKTRIEEIIEFVNKMNYKRLGLAFCFGLRNEAKVVNGLFKSKGLTVASVVCKVGRIDKERIGVPKNQQVVTDSVETMCNPILQASILNSEKTEFNILLGLCVGHDSLFLKHSEALCTVLAVKDRVLGHNPLAAIYNLNSYHSYLK